MRTHLLVFVALVALATIGCGDDPSASAQATSIMLSIDVPRSGQAGFAAILVAHVDPPDAAVDAEITWDFDVAAGESIDATGVAVEATWRRPGTHHVRAIATMPDGQRIATDSTIAIGADFVPPVVRIPDHVDATAGEWVVLDGSASSDNVGITRWAWDADLADGPAIDSDGPVVEHRYARPGTYFASLTVWDAAGLHASSTVRIDVASSASAGDEGPVARLRPPADPAWSAEVAVAPGGADLAMRPATVYVRGEPLRVVPGARVPVEVEARFAGGAVRPANVVSVRLLDDVAEVDGNAVVGVRTGRGEGVATVTVGSSVVEVPFDVAVGPRALGVRDDAWHSIPGSTPGPRVDQVLDVSYLAIGVMVLVDVDGQRFVDRFDAWGAHQARVGVPDDVSVIVAESRSVFWTFSGSEVGRSDDGVWTSMGATEAFGEPIDAVFGDVEIHVFVQQPGGAERWTWRLDDTRWRSADAPARLDACDTLVAAERVGSRIAVACNVADEGRVHLFDVGSRVEWRAVWHAPARIESTVLDASRGDVVVVLATPTRSMHRVALDTATAAAEGGDVPRAMGWADDGLYLVAHDDGVWSNAGDEPRRLTEWTTTAIVALPSSRGPITLDPAFAWISATTPLDPGGTEALNGPPRGGGARAQNADLTDLVSLPDGASIVVELEGVELVDGPGEDVVVFENPFEVSRGLTRWMEPGTVAFALGDVRAAVPSRLDDRYGDGVSGDPGRYASGFFGVVPVRAHAERNDRVPGHPAGGGDRFDLASAGLPAADAVELADVPGDGFSPDLDAVALVHWRRVVRLAPRD